MRVTLLVGVLAGLLGGAAPLRAQAPTYPQELAIIVPKVEVRSGPSAQFPATTELRQGERVVVLRECKEQPGWVEIKPPPGSFTWVNARDVQQHGPWAVVERDTAGLIGSAVVKARPTVERKSGFLAGSVLMVVAQPLQIDGEKWLPVQPDTREVRYLPADAIRPAVAVTPTTPATWAINTKTSLPPTQTIPGYPGGGPTDVRPVGGKTTSFSASAVGQKQWSPYGTLRKTTFKKDDQPMYVLVNNKEQPIYYVTSAPRTSLESFVNRTVTVYGPILSQPGGMVGVPYIEASHVAAVP